MESHKDGKPNAASEPTAESTKTSAAAPIRRLGAQAPTKRLGQPAGAGIPRPQASQDQQTDTQSTSASNGSSPVEPPVESKTSAAGSESDNATHKRLRQTSDTNAENDLSAASADSKTATLPTGREESKTTAKPAAPIRKLGQPEPKEAPKEDKDFEPASDLSTQSTRAPSRRLGAAGDRKATKQLTVAASLASHLDIYQREITAAKDSINYDAKEVFNLLLKKKKDLRNYARLIAKDAPVEERKAVNAWTKDPKFGRLLLEPFVTITGELQQRIQSRQTQIDDFIKSLSEAKQQTAKVDRKSQLALYDIITLINEDENSNDGIISELTADDNTADANIQVFNHIFTGIAKISKNDESQEYEITRAIISSEARTDDDLPLDTLNLATHYLREKITKLNLRNAGKAFNEIAEKLPKTSTKLEAIEKQFSALQHAVEELSQEYQDLFDPNEQSLLTAAYKDAQTKIHEEVEKIKQNIRARLERERAEAEREQAEAEIKRIAETAERLAREQAEREAEIKRQQLEEAARLEQEKARRQAEEDRRDQERKTLYGRVIKEATEARTKESVIKKTADIRQIHALLKEVAVFIPELLNYLLYAKDEKDAKDAKNELTVSITTSVINALNKLKELDQARKKSGALINKFQQEIYDQIIPAIKNTPIGLESDFATLLNRFKQNKLPDTLRKFSIDSTNPKAILDVVFSLGESKRQTTPQHAQYTEEWSTVFNTAKSGRTKLNILKRDLLKHTEIPTVNTTKIDENKRIKSVIDKTEALLKQFDPTILESYSIHRSDLTTLISNYKVGIDRINSPESKETAEGIRHLLEDAAPNIGFLFARDNQAKLEKHAELLAAAKQIQANLNELDKLLQKKEAETALVQRVEIPLSVEEKQEKKAAIERLLAEENDSETVKEYVNEDKALQTSKAEQEAISEIYTLLNRCIVFIPELKPLLAIDEKAITRKEAIARAISYMKKDADDNYTGRNTGIINPFVDAIYNAGIFPMLDDPLKSNSHVEMLERLSDLQKLLDNELNLQHPKWIFDRIFSNKVKQSLQREPTGTESKKPDFRKWDQCYDEWQKMMSLTSARTRLLALEETLEKRLRITKPEVKEDLRAEVEGTKRHIQRTVIAEAEKLLPKDLDAKAISKKYSINVEELIAKYNDALVMIQKLTTESARLAKSPEAKEDPEGTQALLDGLETAIQQTSDSTTQPAMKVLTLTLDPEERKRNAVYLQRATTIDKLIKAGETTFFEAYNSLQNALTPPEAKQAAAPTHEAKQEVKAEENAPDKEMRRQMAAIEAKNQAIEKELTDEIKKLEVIAAQREDADKQYRPLAALVFNLFRENASYLKATPFFATDSVNYHEEIMPLLRSEATRTLKEAPQRPAALRDKHIDLQRAEKEALTNPNDSEKAQAVHIVRAEYKKMLLDYTLLNSRVFYKEMLTHVLAALRPIAEHWLVGNKIKKNLHDLEPRDQICTMLYLALKTLEEKTLVQKLVRGEMKAIETETPIATAIQKVNDRLNRLIFKTKRAEKTVEPMILQPKWTTEPIKRYFSAEKNLREAEQKRAQAEQTKKQEERLKIGEAAYRKRLEAKEAERLQGAGAAGAAGEPKLSSSPKGKS